MITRILSSLSYLVGGTTKRFPRRGRNTNEFANESIFSTSNAPLTGIELSRWASALLRLYSPDLSCAIGDFTHRMAGCIGDNTSRDVEIIRLNRNLSSLFENLY